MRILILILALTPLYSVRSQDCNIDLLRESHLADALEMLENCKAEDQLYCWARKGDLYALNNDLGQAIACYETARTIDSSHPGIVRNLKTCYSNTNNAAKELMIKNLGNYEHFIFNPKLSSLWVIISLIVWLIFIVSILRIYAFEKPLHKAFLVSGLFAVVLTVFSLFSLQTKHYGIIKSDGVEAKSGASITSENVSVLNIGYKVKVLEEKEDWLNVSLATNKKCWINTSEVYHIKK